MSNNRFTKEQLHHIKSLSTAQECLNYAQQEGIKLTKQEAAVIMQEISDEELEKVNGGVGYRRPKHK